MLNKTSLKTWLIIAIILFIAGYGYFRVDNLLRGPKLEITSPADGSDLTESLITITGQAERISKITLNGHQIFTDENGTFSESLLLSPGYNILVVAARDRFDRKISRTLRLTHPESPAPVPAATTTDYL